VPGLGVAAVEGVAGRHVGRLRRAHRRLHFHPGGRALLGQGEDPLGAGQIGVFLEPAGQRLERRLDRRRHQLLQFEVAQQRLVGGPFGGRLGGFEVALLGRFEGCVVELGVLRRQRTHAVGLGLRPQRRAQGKRRGRREQTD
jgi:hypothetical protein